jgi:polysaccharide export outer membrane protein
MRFLNLKITILGEVNNPGTIRLSNKRVTLLEAIGMAGDLSIYANRNNVLVIREENGKRTTARLDLQTAEIFTSPYFYLQQNDVVYIEPTKARIATVADPVQRFISYGSGVLSIVTLIIALTR